MFNTHKPVQPTTSAKAGPGGAEAPAQKPVFKTLADLGGE